MENDDQGNTTTSGAFIVGNYSARTQSLTQGTATATSTGLTMNLVLPTAQI
jgi:hypothetical protein